MCGWRDYWESFNMEKNICIFGDSDTWGAWDRERGGWVARLRSYLEMNNYGVYIYNCAVSGDTTDDLLKRFRVESEARDPDILMFAIGVNDSSFNASKDKPTVALEKFRENLQKLASLAKEFTSDIIFIGLWHLDEAKTMPVPWDSSAYYDQENVDRYDLTIREFCEKNDLAYIYMGDLLQGDDLEDGLHPNPRGHEKIFQRIKDFLIENKLVKR